VPPEVPSDGFSAGASREQLGPGQQPELVAAQPFGGLVELHALMVRPRARGVGGHGSGCGRWDSGPRSCGQLSLGADRSGDRSPAVAAGGRLTSRASRADRSGDRALAVAARGWLTSRASRADRFGDRAPAVAARGWLTSRASRADRSGESAVSGVVVGRRPDANNVNVPLWSCTRASDGGVSTVPKLRGRMRLTDARPEAAGAVVITTVATASASASAARRG